MTKHILLLVAVLGFIVQFSVFAANPNSSPHQHKHHKKSTAPRGDSFSLGYTEGILTLTWRDFGGERDYPGFACQFFRLQHSIPHTSLGSS